MTAKNQYNAKEFIRAFENNYLGNIFLFLGDEEGLKVKYTLHMLESLEKKYGKGMVSFSQFHADSEDISKFIECSLSASMFEPAKLSVLYGTDVIQTTNENKSLFALFFKELPSTTTIILYSDGYNIPKIIPKEYHDTLITVKFWRLFQNEIEQYIKQEFSKRNIECAHDAVQSLIILLGNDVKKIDEAIEKISFSGQNTITKQFLEGFISSDRDSNIFEYIESVLNKSPQSLTLLNALLLDGINELIILSMLTRNFENIMRFHKAIRQNKTPHEALDMLGIKEKQKNAFITRANNFTPNAILKIFSLVYDTEKQIKGGLHHKSALANPLVGLTSNIIFMK
jgi:DNA polymerase III delta subunit